MHLINRLRKPLLTGRRAHQPAGAVLIALIIAIMLFASLGAAIYSISSSGTYGSLASNLAMRAYYAAESGYRYAAGEYRNRDGILEKMIFLKNLHGIIRNLPDSLGSFSIKNQPYFFITSAPVNAGDNFLSVTAPGVFPPGFTVPDTTRISIGGAIYDAVLGAQTASGNVDFQVPAGLGEDLGANAIVCLVAVTAGTQSLTSGGTLTLSAASGGFFPDRNGRIQIGPVAHNLVFSYKERGPNPPPGSIVLTGIQGVNDEAKTALSPSLPLDAGSNVTLKPFLGIVLTGSAGGGFLGGSREITYAVPITDEIQGSGLEENEDLLIEDFENLDKWVPNENVQINTALSTNWDPSRGALLGGDDHTPAADPDPDNPIKNIRSIFLIPDLQAEFADAWDRSGHYLSYDVQVKHKWDSGMTHAADGICVRWRDPGIPGRYQGLGVSFICYSSTGDDFIPNSIKPPNLADTPLIVLWEQRISGVTVTRRWVAYKNISAPDPDGHDYVLDADNMTFSELSSLFIRVEEKSVNGAPKTTSLKVFYGDASTMPGRAAILGNDIPDDIIRRILLPSWVSGISEPFWPGNIISEWAQETDFITLVKWDEINEDLEERYQSNIDRTSVSTRDFATPEDVFSNRDEIALHAFGDLSNTILFDDFAARILGGSGGAGQSSGFAIPLQQ